MLSPKNMFAGRSRLGICCHGPGSFVFMALHNSLAFWHILNSVRGTSTVSIRGVRLQGPFSLLITTIFPQLRWHSANWHPILNNRSEAFQHNSNGTTSQGSLSARILLRHLVSLVILPITEKNNAIVVIKFHRYYPRRSHSECAVRITRQRTINSLVNLIHYYAF